MRSLATATAGAALLSSCAPIASCSPALQGLAGLQCAAASGSKAAQLELGKAYEAGSGVPQDLRRAARLYEAAASQTSGTIYVYSPKVGNAPAQVLPVRAGPDQPPLPEVLHRLALLYRDGRGVRRDLKKAARLMEQAAMAGYISRD